MALHIACGDITDVAFDGETFEINTTDMFLYDLLQSEDNMKELKSAFLALGIEKFKINKKEKVLTKAQHDIIKLKEIFGDNLIIE